MWFAFIIFVFLAFVLKKILKKSILNKEEKIVYKKIGELKRENTIESKKEVYRLRFKNLKTALKFFVWAFIMDILFIIIFKAIFGSLVYGILMYIGAMILLNIINRKWVKWEL